MSFYGWCIVIAAALVALDLAAFSVWAFLVLVVRPRQSRRQGYERTFFVDTRRRP